ncbi:2801_t:CDS:1, partial [Rhizophagus irregularis]
LINLLQEFTEDGESDFEELNEINETNPEDEIIDKENVDPLMPILRNPKKRSDKGRPLGTKRFKSSTEAPKPKSRNQRNCRKCGK